MRNKRVVKIGNVSIGGNHPIAIQSMIKTPTSNTKEAITQIKRLEKAGCEIVRLAVVNSEDVPALKEIKKASNLPIVADIHFDYRLALSSIDMGVDKIRINPGNIGERWKITEIIKKSKARNIPIRIGINSGSLTKQILKKFGHPTPEAMIETLEATVSIFLDNNYENIVISAKGVDVTTTVKTYQYIDKKFDYPLHLGITEAGLPFRGGIKSGVALGVLLNQGIGDTVRVSLTAAPVMEVVAGYEILNSLGLRRDGPVLISCPTCGRCEVNLEKIALEVETRLKRYKKYMKVAVMGCVVNGPGEAREADFGIACGRGIGAIFAKGKELKRVSEEKIVDTLFEVIDENINN